jgi:hypothetical protein
LKPVMLAVVLVMLPPQGNPLGVTVAPHPVAVADVTEITPAAVMEPLTTEPVQVATVLPFNLTTRLLELAVNVPFVQARAGEAVKPTAAAAAAVTMASFVVRDMKSSFS